MSWAQEPSHRIINTSSVYALTLQLMGIRTQSYSKNLFLFVQMRVQIHTEISMRFEKPKSQHPSVLTQLPWITVYSRFRILIRSIQWAKNRLAIRLLHLPHKSYLQIRTTFRPSALYLHSIISGLRSTRTTNYTLAVRTHYRVLSNEEAWEMQPQGTMMYCNQISSYGVSLVWHTILESRIGLWCMFGSFKRRFICVLTDAQASRNYPDSNRTRWLFHMQSSHRCSINPEFDVSVHSRTITGFNWFYWQLVYSNTSTTKSIKNLEQRNFKIRISTLANSTYVFGINATSVTKYPSSFWLSTSSSNDSLFRHG